MKHSLSRAGVTALLLAACSTLLAQESAAKIVDEGKLAQYCREEAIVRIKNAGELIILPVEKNHGKFHVYGQTDQGSPVLFECTFDANRTFLGIKVTGDHDHGDHAAKGAPKAAINKCLQILGVPAKIEQVNPLRPPFYEIIMKEKASPRRVACTVPADGSEIEDWVEMN
jgi:hypothetical protein